MSWFRNASFFMIFLTVILLNTCSENPHQLSVTIFDSNIPGVVKDTTLFVIRDTSYSNTSTVSTQTSLRLLLGSSDGLMARPILRFTNFLEFPDSALIDSVKIKLYSSGSSGSGGQTPFTATMYPVLAIWTSNLDSVWSDYNLNIDRTSPLGSLSIIPSDTIKYIFQLNQEGIDLVNVWADSATDPLENYGLLIDFENADFIQYFYAINSGYDPELIVKYHFPGDTTVYVDSLIANYDAYLYSGEINKTESRNYVSTLLVNRTLLEFDLQSFFAIQPREISLRSASLELPVDRENSSLNQKFGVSTQVALQLVSGWEEPSIVVDSVTSYYAAIAKWSTDSSYISIDANNNQARMADLVRMHLADSTKYNGFVISFIDGLGSSTPFMDEKDFFTYLAYYKRQETDILRRARLRLIYWVPAEPRL